jgi:hypothetical protein
VSRAIEEQSAEDIMRRVEQGPRDQDWTYQNSGEDDIDFIAEARQLMSGTSTMLVTQHMIEALLQARAVRNPIVLVVEMVFSAAISFTVSAKWDETYNRLVDSPYGALHHFKIQGRAPSANGKDRWVAQSQMNATAARLMGHLVAYASPQGSYLRTVAEAKGTVFNPKPPPTDATPDKEYNIITRAAAAELSEAERALPATIRDSMPILLQVVNRIFGAGVTNIETLLNLAAETNVIEF